MHVGVREWGERIVFLRTLKSGGASKSYGIQCARLAGMPKAVVSRASSLLKQLERQQARGQGPQLSLFSGSEVSDDESVPAVSDPIKDALAALDPNALTPREALDTLYRLKGMMD
jgi:DNA mismatch repair protein MutS